MAGDPTYPDDAPVGDPAASGPGVAEPAGAKAPADKGGEASRARNIVTGAAIGIGSAALVAALLYASRSRKSGGQDDK
ncbi:MAG TPA: hypothetical protein VN231_00385 [Allosphingosinicella sp.]|nr:hypothetical protein [Allosphingosinicella sp.]